MDKKIDSKKLYESELFDSGLFVSLENGKTVRVGEPSDPNNPQDTLYTFNYFEKVIDDIILMDNVIGLKDEVSTQFKREKYLKRKFDFIVIFITSRTGPALKK